MPTRAKRSIGLLLLSILSLTPFFAFTVAAAPVAGTGNFGVVVGSNGAHTLLADAPATPAHLKPHVRWGIFDSAAFAFPKPFTSVKVAFAATAKAGSDTMVAVRGHSGNGRWSAWTTDVLPGSTVAFERAMQVVQYRVVLLGSAKAGPTVSKVQVTPNGYAPRLEAAASRWAPTYRLRITRQGMVGGRTANGHIITRNDVFVSLPSWSSLASKGGYEYQVRLSANGRSVVAPVWDVGPWNHNDNFWDAKRKTYRDLPQGWPEDHAAYYEGYNDRMAEEGWVRFPTAVDIGDGAYWALGLAGAQGTVDVTFLWLGDDPGPNPTPRNGSPSQRPRPPAEDSEPTATPTEPEPTPRPKPEPTAEPDPTPVPVEPTPTPVPDAPIEEDLPEPDPIVLEQVVVEAGGEGFDANTTAWNYAVCDDDKMVRSQPGDPVGSRAGLWRPQLMGGTYKVLVHIPLCAGREPTTQGATYTIHTADGSEPTVMIDQAANPDGWVELGEWSFAAGNEGFVKLTSAVADPGHAVWFDAVQWVRSGN